MSVANRLASIALELSSMEKNGEDLTILALAAARDALALVDIDKTNRYHVNMLEVIKEKLDEL